MVYLVKNTEMGRACSTYGEERCIHGFGGEHLRETQLGRSRRRWENNIKVDLEQVGEEHGNEPSDSIKCREFLYWLMVC